MQSRLRVIRSSVILVGFRLPPLSPSPRVPRDGRRQPMSTAAKITAPKGTVDILPTESWKWQTVEQIARQTAAQFNFGEIRTPIFEHTELFHRGVGETTDVVSKETYTFNDR